RTSTDYVNHQPKQVEMLSNVDEYHAVFSPQRNLRQNLLLSFLAGALGLAPSCDVFITNRAHPEGFADPNASREALLRALSAGIVGLGDKLGCVDREIVDRLAFPDGTLAQPDHPPYPVTSTLQSGVPAFFTTTRIAGYRWSYVALFNLTEEAREYRLDLAPLMDEPGGLVYDYQAGSTVPEVILAGDALPGEGRYLVIVPKVGGLYLLGFPEKYITLSGRQVKEVQTGPEGVRIDLELPAGRSYTFAAFGASPTSASGHGIQVLAIERRGELTCVEFHVETRRCSLVLRS
ncbi:MAG: hypothetical protein V3U35_00835, partial [Candidatus Neomarinimicrobiota bacterium]